MFANRKALSIDLEHWYSNEFLLKHLPEDPESQITEATDSILELLRKYDTKATFFVLGTVAEKYPDYVRSIAEEGHEICSHAYSHTPLYRLGRDGFEEELRISTRLLRSITGEQPLGFRAPSFSVNQSTSWVFELLEKYGYRYDSSVFPVTTNLYGVPRAPLVPYRPDREDIARDDPDGKIIEVPLAVLKAFVRVPVAGGFYFRVLPGWFIDYSISKIAEVRSMVFYIHPWETYRDTPRLKVPLLTRIEAYFGIDSSLQKFERILSRHRFEPIRNILDI